MDKPAFDALFTNFQKATANISELTAVPGLVEKPIVVLVHGIDGNADNWSKPLAQPTDQSWLFDLNTTPAITNNPYDVISSPGLSQTAKNITDKSWARALTVKGINYINFTQTEPSGELEVAAKDLKTILTNLQVYIYDKLQENDVKPPLILLCHSRGGLVARLALKELKKEGGVPTYLSQVITLCTPHGGSYMPRLSQDYDSLIGGANSFERLAKSLLGPVHSSQPGLLDTIIDEAEKFLRNPPGVGIAKGAGFSELIPGSKMLETLEKEEEPLDKVLYYSVGGTVPAFVKLYVTLPDNYLLDLFTISNTRLIKLLVEEIPLLRTQLGGLAELDKGDSSVALERSRWPDHFKATHREFPVNHMQALVDEKLQEAVVNLILGKGFFVEGETLIREDGTLSLAASSAWLEDTTVSALHDAFMLGWTNIELKSRVQIAVLDKQVDDFLPKLEEATSPMAGGIIDFLLKEVENLTRRKTRPDASDRTLLNLTSIWRALFNRLAALHYKRFPDSNYPLKSKSDWLYYKNLSNAGINMLEPIQNGKDTPKNPLEDFGLYDLTRRAINSLVLLRSNPTGAEVGELIAQIPPLEQVAPGIDTPEANASEQLKRLIVQSLEAWDAFLREQFFSGGQFKNDATELTAYEAGRSLATLSWSVSVKTASLEKTLEWLRTTSPKKDPAKILEMLKKSLEGLTTFEQSLGSQITNVEQLIKETTAANKPEQAEKLTKISQVLNSLQSLWSTVKGPERFKALSEAVQKTEAESRTELSEATLTQLKRALTDLIDSDFKQKLKGGLTELEQTLTANQDPLVPAEAAQLGPVLLEALQNLKASADSVTLLDNKLRERIVEAITDSWVKVFEKSRIIEAQHQVTSLSTTLDDAYYRLNQDMKMAAGEDGSVSQSLLLNPDLPSQALHAVRHSLDYWQRTVDLLPRKDPNSSKLVDDITPGSRNGKVKSGSTSNSNQKVSLAASELNTEEAKNSLVLDEEGKWCPELRLALIQQSNVWQGLVSCQQSLRSFSAESVTQKILNDFMADLERAGGKLLAKNKWLIFGLGLVVLAVIALLVYLIFINPNTAKDNWQSVVLAGIAGIGAILGGNQLIKVSGPVPIAPASSSGAGTTVNLFTASGEALVEAFQNGLNQIRVEFAYLNYNISVAYPLVEFFILNEFNVLVQPSKPSSKVVSRKPAGNSIAPKLGFLSRLPNWITLTLIILIPAFIVGVGIFLLLTLSLSLEVGQSLLIGIIIFAALSLGGYVIYYFNYMKRASLAIANSWWILVRPIVLFALLIALSYLLIGFISGLNTGLSISGAILVGLIVGGVIYAQANKAVPKPIEQAIHNGYEFLSLVVWTNQEQAEEITRVARAAFGPVGGIIGAYLSEPKK